MMLLPLAHHCDDLIDGLEWVPDRFDVAHIVQKWR